jgi:hypothetical protein
MTLVYLELQLHKFLKLVMTCSINSKKILKLEQSQIADKSLVCNCAYTYARTRTSSCVSMGNMYVHNAGKIQSIVGPAWPGAKRVEHSSS